MQGYRSGKRVGLRDVSTSGACAWRTKNGKKAIDFFSLSFCADGIHFFSECQHQPHLFCYSSRIMLAQVQSVSLSLSTIRSPRRRPIGSVLR